MSDPKKDYTLSPYWQEACNAHSNTSFYPEKRADQYITGYSAELDEDLATLGDKQGNYKEKYISKFRDWMGAKSRCLSTMITGPANFPTRRAMKANDSERNKGQHFFDWREKYFTSVNRVKTLSPEAELDNCMAELDKLIIFNEMAKEYNKIVAAGLRKNIQGIEIIEQLKVADVGDMLIEYATNDAKMYGGRVYKIGSQAAQIRKVKEKVDVMKSRIETKANWEDIKFEDGYITLEDDRVKIFHDDKPEQEVIALLKRRGFKWSRNWGCWCRKHTSNAVYDAKFVCNPVTA